MGSKEFTKKLIPSGDDRLRININTEKGNVTDVVVQYESKIKDKWYPIVRYDCSHGFFHRDILNPKGEKIKQPIPIQNLRDALTYAEQDIKDRWEWYKERFKKRNEIMTKKECAERNIGMTFDFIRQILENPDILETIPAGAELDFIDKDMPFKAKEILKKKKVARYKVTHVFVPVKR